MRWWALLLVILAICGCTSEQEARTMTSQNLASGGTVVGKLPDGRTVTKFHIVNSGTGSEVNHYIYVVEDSSSVTTNREVPVGKSSYNAVDATIGEVKN